MHPARTRSLPVRYGRRPLHGVGRVLLGGLTAIIGLVSLVMLPYPLWLMTRACWQGIDWIETVDQPINGPLLILAAVTAAWVFWTWLVYATIADTVAALRGGSHTRMRLPVPLHRAVTAAAGLLGALLQPGIAAAGTATTSAPALQPHAVADRATTTTVPAPPAVTSVTPVTVPAAAVTEPAIYTVRRGDALNRIAKTQLGDAKRWPEIYTLNRGTRFPGVGGTLTDPDVIYPGWRLKIPAPPTPPASTTAAEEPPAPTTTATVTPEPTPPPAPVSSEAAPPAADNTTSRHHRTSLLPWLALLGIPVIVALLRRRRRTDSTGTPAAAETRPEPRTDPVETAAPAVPPDAPVAEEAVTVDPGAVATPDQHAAACRVIAAVLDDPDGDPDTIVIVPRTTLRILMPDRQVPSGLAALTVTATVGDAVIGLEAETLHRARLVVEHDADDYADIRDIECLPRIVLVTHADRGQRTRMAVAVEQARAYDIQAIILDRPVADRGTTPRREPPPAAAGATLVATAAAAEEPAPQKVRVQVIGDVNVLDRRGRPVPGLRGRAKEMLTYLAVRRDGAELPEIMEALWPDATVNRASERLSTEVGNLRRTVRMAAGDGGVQAVDNPGGRYVLNTDVLDVDAWQLDQALTDNAPDGPEASDAPDGPAGETRLRTAVALHTGELAGNATYAWIEAARERYRRQGITARQRLAALIAPTRPDEAAALLDAAADIDPYNDALACAAIEAFAAVNATDAAHRRFEQLRAALADIDAQPDPATLAHVEAMLGRVPDVERDQAVTA